MAEQLATPKIPFVCLIVSIIFLYLLFSMNSSLLWLAEAFCIANLALTILAIYSKPKKEASPSFALQPINNLSFEEEIEQKEPEPNPSSDFQEEEPTKISKEEEKSSKLDELLAKIIRAKIEDGTLEFKPELELEDEGEYDVLGRKLKGKVKFVLSSRQAEPQRKKRTKEPNEEDEEVVLL